MRSRSGVAVCPWKLVTRAWLTGPVPAAVRALTSKCELAVFGQFCRRQASQSSSALRVRSSSGRACRATASRQLPSRCRLVGRRGSGRGGRCERPPVPRACALTRRSPTRVPMPRLSAPARSEEVRAAPREHMNLTARAAWPLHRGRHALGQVLIRHPDSTRTTHGRLNRDGRTRHLRTSGLAALYPELRCTGLREGPRQLPVFPCFAPGRLCCPGVPLSHNRMPPDTSRPQVRTPGHRLGLSSRGHGASA